MEGVFLCVEGGGLWIVWVVWIFWGLDSLEFLDGLGENFWSSLRHSWGGECYVGCAFGDSRASRESRLSRMSIFLSVAVWRFEVNGLSLP